MNGSIEIASTPTLVNHATRKDYVDDRDGTSASNGGSTSTVSTSTNTSDIASATITAPRAGYVTVNATLYCRHAGTGSLGYGYVYLATTSGGTSNFRNRVYRTSTTTEYLPVSVTGRFSVAAGTRTIYLTGYVNSTSILTAWGYPSITLTWSPH